MTAMTIAVAAQGQRPTAKEQTILNVFGRLNLETDPFDNLNYWTDGGAFYRPFFNDPYEYDAKPRSNGDFIYLFGGTLHEGGWGVKVRLAADGKMTMAEDDYRFNKGDRVDHRIIDNQALLIFSDVRTGSVKEVWKKFDGNLFDRYIDGIYRYMLSGTHVVNSGGPTNGQVVIFDREKSVVSGLLLHRETPYTFVKDFGDTPIPTLFITKEMIYKVGKTLDGLELLPMKKDPDFEEEEWNPQDGDWLTEDLSKPFIRLVTADEEEGLPSGRFPLASVQVMTLTDLEMHAGQFRLPNLQIMRNEIYARHGHKFRAGGEMHTYFGKQMWYRPQYDDVTSKLTEVEQINITLIQVLEKKYAGEPAG